MEQPISDDNRQAFASYMTFWMTHFIQGLSDAHLLEKVKWPPDSSESGECMQIRTCIEQAIANAVEAYFNKMEKQQIISEAKRIVNRQ